ncbi:MAG: aminoacyl-tRNA hydrolase [Candidatus Pacearchaeota archaeon]
MVKKRDVKQVVVMRKDLGMRTGKMVAQGCHAVLGLYKRYTELEAKGTPKPEAMRQWEQDHEHGFAKICLRVESEHELLELAHKARAMNIPCTIITDSGKTEFNNVPTITCMAIGPDYSDRIDQITGHLKLL